MQSFSVKAGCSSGLFKVNQSQIHEENGGMENGFCTYLP